ncbi:hypothetical protein JOE40_002600 [Arthrobacter sp. PvP102]|jgi:hypothetical protein|uniref:hypothetical protein n=1 Tax=unclassified Arthrobacter TaxID=235627 RepID=UPI001AE8185C|nr:MULTISPECIES: hypothetical protein [unclassified Arthrobacter]MBP1232956.1 hypothetical protein [Arthrobacter sp. PvP103]MBP1238091.1 hypothetical protein [Arthrobacter sp. PvP102]
MLGTRSCLAAALAATLVAIATPAQAAPATLVSAGPGILVADGAAVDVPVTFVCDTDPALIIAIPVVQLTQRVSDGRIAAGGGNDQLSCTKQTQTVTIRVIPNMMAFNEGAAAASVYLQTCSAQFQCSAKIVHTEITLANPAGDGQD